MPLINAIKRNIKIYFRSPSIIISGLCIVFILLSIHFLFLRTNIVENMYKLQQIKDKKTLYYLCDNIMFAALIPMTAVTVSLSVLSLLIKDKENDRIKDFIVMPNGNFILMISYFITSFIISFLFCLLFLMLSQFCTLFLYHKIFTFIQFIFVILAILFCLIFSIAFVFFFVILLNSQTALSGLGAGLGVCIGFLSGAFIPFEGLNTNVANIFTLLPFALITSLFKKIYTLNLANYLNISQSVFDNTYGKNYGINIYSFNNNLTTPLLISNYIFFILLFIIIDIFIYNFILKIN